MSGMSSGWIPARRIRLALGLAAALAAAAGVGAAWARGALLLLVPAAGAGWTGAVMLAVRRQLSDGGGGWERRLHQEVLARLPLPAGGSGRVLDVGCGDGGLLAALLARAPGLEATGVDWWGERWDYAQARCEARLRALGLRASFRRMDAARLDFPDQHFDLVVSVMCFHEVQAPPGAAAPGPLLALAEAMRVLRPGGALVLVDRFADRSDFGDGAGLQAVLASASELRREPVVATLGVPWPLSSRRALGPVELLSGRKAGPAPG